MNKYIKTYEDFEFKPEDFLEDFGIEVLTFDLILKAIKRFEYRDTTIMNIIKRAEAVRSNREENGDDVLTLVSMSKYNFEKWADIPRLFPHLAFLKEQGYPLDIDIEWLIEFRSSVNSAKNYEVSSVFNPTAFYPNGSFSEYGVDYMQFIHKMFSSFQKRRDETLFGAVERQIDLINTNIQIPAYEAGEAIFDSNLAKKLNSWIGVQRKSAL